METLYFWVHLLFGLLLPGICLRPSFAFPHKHHRQLASFLRAPFTGSSKYTAHGHQKAPAEEQEQVNTVRVTCHPDSLEIVINADLFGVGAPVDVDEIRLGVKPDEFCRATASSEDEYRIVVGLVDCGTKHWMDESVLAYTNLLIYSPVASPGGVIRMDEAVIPIECYYKRKYNLSSSSLVPTWIPFMSTQAAVETLEFNLRIMTNDWQYERRSNVFYFGDLIGLEASVRVGYHMRLRVFVSSCVATLDPDINSVPRYVFVENGCLVDSMVPGSKSHFLSRTQDDKLHLFIDAFRFHNEDRGELYITCQLNAVSVNDAEAPNKACTFVNDRWRSADGNDYLCQYCTSQNIGSQKPRSSGKFGPRGFGAGAESKTFWGSGLKTNEVWHQESRLGPVLVLPAKQKTEHLPVEEHPPVLNKISRPALYGSQWRSGISFRKDSLETGLLPPTPEQVEVHMFASEQNKDVKSETGLNDDDAESEVAGSLESLGTEVTLKSMEAALDTNSTATLSDVIPTAQFTMDVTTLSNTTATESELSAANDLKSK